MTTIRTVLHGNGPGTQSDWLTAVLKLGVPAFIALLLVWFMASRIDGGVLSLQRALNDHVLESTFYLRAICLNAAGDESERARCVSPLK